MADLVKRYEKLKKKKQDLVNEKTKKQTQLEQAEEVYQEKLKELKDKFEVSNLEEAKELRDSLEKEIKDVVPELEDKMSEYEDILDVK